MTLQKNKIIDLQTLRFEKIRLTDIKLQKEQELNSSIDYIQNNFGKIILKTVFNSYGKSSGDKFEFVKEVVGSSVDEMVDMVTDKENRKEHAKKFAKNVLSTVVYRLMK